MTQYEFTGNDPTQYAETLAAHYTTMLEQAITVGYPEHVGRNPLEVFPEPTLPRDQAPKPDWSDDQEAEMREIVSEFGYGREADRTVSSLGLQQAHVIIEGGQPHKIKAEIATVTSDTEAQPSSYIFSGSAERKILGAERDSALAQLGYVPETEYDVTRAIAESTEGFVSNPDGDEVLNLSYDIHNEFVVSDEPTGQFVHIGSINGRPVVLLRIDRENYVEAGKAKYRHQPAPADVMRIVSQAQAGTGGSEAPIAYVSSATYQASREIDAVRAGLATGRAIGVSTYGSARLAEIKGEPQPTPSPVNQIPGELFVAAQSLAALNGELGA